MYRAVTHGFQVDVEPLYLEEKSSQSDHRFVFAYRVRIKNLSAPTAQLISRHWVIRDATGRIEEVRGDGVVGEQPILAAGHAHDYTSFSQIETPTGTMRGTYLMRALVPVPGVPGEFEITIPEFKLQTEWGLAERATPSV